jgi:uncharacterized iron-regulated membrane protein
MKTDARLGAPQALWSAAACCRFSPASLLALHRFRYRPPVYGQQAGLTESGSKLPHSRAVTACVWYTAVVVSLLGVAGLLSRVPAAQLAAPKGELIVPPVRLTTMVKAAG